MDQDNNQKTKRKEQGQSMTEFAVSLVFLLILLAGLVDLGRAFFAYIIIRDAAQEGAVYGAINKTKKYDINAFKNSVNNRVKSAFINPDAPNNSPIDVNDLTITTEIIGDPCVGSGNGVRVTVDYKLPVSMPFLGAILGSQEINMSTSVEDTTMLPYQCP